MVGLPKAYQDVYETSKDVVRLKQRNLTKEVVERLNIISLPEDTTITTLTNDQIRFFFNDILSLVVDNDVALQNDAINAITKLISKLQTTAYQKSPEWPFIRDRIVEDYSIAVCRIRDSSNSHNWYKIWCLLIHILDHDIVRSVFIVNKYLAIVEQSFKNPNLEIRGQAYICWKVLIKIFFKHNELIPTKRVKLITIPFRSAQAKSLYIAETKFDAFWYLLVKLSESAVNNGDCTIKNSLELHHTFCFGPFLTFCFGNNPKENVPCLKNYPKLNEMSVFVFISMFNISSREINLKLENLNLEVPKDTIITETLMKNNWKIIIRSCFEATLIIVEQSNARDKLIELLWNGVVNQLLQIQNSDVYKEICTIIKRLIQTDKDNLEFCMKPNILLIIEIFGKHHNYLYDINSYSANYVQIYEIIVGLTDILLINDDQYIPPDVYEPIIQNIFNIEKYKNLTKFWDLQKDLIEYILTIDQLNDFTSFEIKIAIWKSLSVILLNYMDMKIFEFRLKSKYEIINKWIIWPLRKCGWINENNRDTINKVLDKSFFIIWNKIMCASSNAEGKSNFSHLILPSMKMLCDKRENIPNFDDILSCYIDCMDNNFDINLKPSESLDFIKTTFSKSPYNNSMYNNSVEKLTNYFCSLNDKCIGIIFEDLKAITTALAHSEKLKYITKNCFEMYKKSLTELLRKESIDKKFFKEFRSALKSDEYVIIPSVWALNPDRLTEHQKEKMKEKKDNIPALYNDMNSDSHSQDSSSIKPWTPNKIVIPRGKTQLIISSPIASSNEKHVESEKHTEKVQNIETSPFKIPKDKLNTSELVTSKSIHCDHLLNTNDDDNNEKIDNNEIIQNLDSQSLEVKTEGKEKTNVQSRQRKFKITKAHEQLLKSMNIKIDDAKKKHSLLNNLQALQIDTIEGKSLLNSKNLQSKENGVRTRKSANPKKIAGTFTNKINDVKDINKKDRKNRISLVLRNKSDKDNKEKITAKLNDTNENKIEVDKQNKKIRKSLIFNKSEIENKDATLEKLSEGNENKIEVDKKLRQGQNKSNKDKMQNSEDEVVESSQTPAQNISRRIRRTSGSLPIAMKNDDKKTNSIADTFDKLRRSRSRKSVSYEKDNVVSESKKSPDGKTRTLRSTSNSSMIVETKIKISPSEKQKVPESNRISKIDTEFSAELIQIDRPVLRSPSKAENNANTTPKKGNEDQKENQNDNILRKTRKNSETPEKSTHDIDKKFQLNTESNNHLRNNLPTDSEILSKSEYPRKSPRKRLHYETAVMEDNIEIKRMTQNNGDDYEPDEQNTNILRLTVESSNSVPETRIENNFNENTTPTISEVPENRQIIESVFSRVTRSSPKKSPSLNKNNGVEMEIQSNKPLREELEIRSPKKLTTFKTLMEKEVISGSPTKLVTSKPSIEDEAISESSIKLATSKILMEKEVISESPIKLATSKTLMEKEVISESPIKLATSNTLIQKEVDVLSPVKLATSKTSIENEVKVQSPVKLATPLILQTEVSTSVQSPINQLTPIKKKISEIDTEPNTETLNVTNLNKSNGPNSPRTPQHTDIYKYIEDIMPHSPAYSPIKSLSYSAKKSLNKSIVASPECRNLSEKNEEFINDTLDISPIAIDIDQFEESTKNANQVFDELKNLTENERNLLEESKLTSPPKKQLRSLHSPPDRQNTNNSTSPMPKPKTQSGLTGRGAQLINMIRNRKVDQINRITSSELKINQQEEISSSQERNQQNLLNFASSSPKKSMDNNNLLIAPPTPVQANQTVCDLLTFSKVLPSPYASPTASILKRKLRNDSFDDFESPANKRKRVSFHDPPVSITKEYVKHIEEEKSNQNRFKALQERTSTPTNIVSKHILKRKNRMESMFELARFNDSPIHSSNIKVIELQKKSNENIVNDDNNVMLENETELGLIPPTKEIRTIDFYNTSNQNRSDKHINGSVEMDSLKFNTTNDDNNKINSRRNSIQYNINNNNNNINMNNVVDDNEDLGLMTLSPSMYFTDEASVLKYVVEKYSFEEIYEKYSNRYEDKTYLTNKLIRIIFKDISTIMEKDVRIKTNILEMLSEKHPKEFLDHAIQENLSSVVCNRLNTNSIIDFICETFKNNIESRKMILDKICNLLTIDRFKQERHEFFLKLLNYENMSSEEIVNCIEIISKNRR